MGRYYIPEKTQRVKIENNEPVEVRLTGGRWWAIAIISLLIAVDIGSISSKLGDANKLKEEELKIQREQLDLARRQFTLDSIMAVKNEKMR